MQARHMRVKLQYDGEDISENIAPFLKSFQFKDSVSNEADDIQVTLEDRQELWESDWFPTKGSTLKASFIATNWNGEGDKEYPVGTFEIDEIEISGLPHEVKIKAVSVPNNNDLRGIQRNKAWENVKISTIAKEIADRAELKLYLNLHEDAEIERLEQREESDLAFLTRVAKEKSYGVRLSDTQLDVYYIPDLDIAEPIATIRKKASRISNYSFRSKTRDTYKAAHVRYENAKKGVLIEYTFNDPDKKAGKVLEIHKKVADEAEAEKLAKAELREKNKDEITGRISFGGLARMTENAVSDDGTGRNLWLAGFTVALSGFHTFDGKYLVTGSSHSLSMSSGYSCNIDIRRCLNGY